MKSKLTYLKKLELFKELDNFKEGEFYAIVDQKVKNHLPQWIQFSPQVFWLSHPEEQKNLEDYARATQFFIKQGIHRKSRLYVFGGGATTDFGGFVAATILRGISWVAIPTTLLAMIDGSIGGKVAINMPQGKNLLGSFHLPENVYICGDFLTSLPEAEWISGKGEVLKYGFLSRDIHQLILKKAPISDIAHECAKFKSKVVENDFKEEGERILLNLGHTLGHAFESTLKIPHGLAVGMGLKYLFEVMDLNEARLEWEKMAKALSLPIERYDVASYPRFSFETFFSYLEQDKKKVQTKIRLVLVKSIGSCYVEEVPIKGLKNKLLGHHEFAS